MKKVMFLSLVLAATLALASFAPLAALSAPEKNTIRVMIAYKPGQKSAVERLVKKSSAEIHYAFDSLNVLTLTLPAAALDGISHNPLVVYVEEDPIRSMTGSPLASGEQSPGILESSLIPQTVPYGIDMVQARDVWDADRDGVVDAGAPTGAGRTICIIDSGIYAAHEDLAGVNILGGYPTGWDSDLYGHGTHVAGTIAALNNSYGVVGVTPGAVNLYIVKVFGDSGTWTYASTLVDAANRCAAAGANIISMSLSGSASSRTEKNAFQNLYNQGILSIAAASNYGTSAYFYPASYPSVISVGAVDSDMTWASFSNYNDQVELAAPGVGVLSSLSYLDSSTVLVEGVMYPATHIEYSGRSSTSGELVNGGLCDSAGSWTGKVVLCERGGVDFNIKVANVQAGGGVAALVYNNIPGTLLATLGTGNSSTIAALGLSQEDGRYLVASKLGVTAGASSQAERPASAYEAWDGTSMATPHVSAVAALTWSARPSATNAEVRAALTATAHDLGAAGRDVYYGYGLVQAKDALDYLVPTVPDNYTRVAALSGAGSWVTSTTWKATVTITVTDASGAAVGNATVTGAFSGAISGTVSCTTDATGRCSVSSAAIKRTSKTATFTVSKITHATLLYEASANLAGSIIVNKP